jgi:hypothetical protein
MALELTPQQVAQLERLVARGFAIVAFPLYASHVGVRREHCAALLEPSGAGMRIFGSAFYLVEGNPAVRVRRGGRDVYVWKKAELDATPQRERELAEFAADLQRALESLPA